jgi:hypothetical protein
MWRFLEWCFKGCVFFAALLVVFSQARAVGFMVFSDIEEGSWYAPYVARLVDMGIITGYDDNTFRPAGDVNRAEVATLLGRYHKYLLDEYFPQKSFGDEKFLEFIRQPFPDGRAKGGGGSFDGAGGDIDSAENFSSSSDERPVSPVPPELISDVLPTEESILATYSDPGELFEELCADSEVCTEKKEIFLCDDLIPIKNFLPKVPMAQCAVEIKPAAGQIAVFTESQLKIYQYNFIVVEEGRERVIRTMEDFANTFKPLRHEFDALNFLLATNTERAVRSRVGLVKYPREGSYHWNEEDEPTFTNIVRDGNTFVATLYSVPRLPCGDWPLVAKTYRVSEDAQTELIEERDIGVFKGDYLCE